MRMYFWDVWAVVQPIIVNKLETVRIAQGIGTFDSETLQISGLNLGSSCQPDCISGSEIDFQIAVCCRLNTPPVKITAPNR